MIVSKAELEALVEGTGWRAARYVDGEDGLYVVVLAKT
jgi:hypothetical protein